MNVCGSRCGSGVAVFGPMALAGRVSNGNVNNNMLIYFSERFSGLRTVRFFMCVDCGCVETYGTWDSCRLDKGGGVLSVEAFD